MFISLFLEREGVCVPALTVPMCVALILVFPLTIPHFPLLFFSLIFDGYTFASSQFQIESYLSIYFVLHKTTLHISFPNQLYTTYIQ